MTPVVNQQFLAALENAVNSNMLAMARRMLADVGIAGQKRSRLFELAAIVELKSGQPDPAEAYLIKGVACKDASAFCHYLLGSVRLSKQDFAGAVDSLTTAVKKGANFLECRFNLAMALIQSGQGEAALPHLDSVLEAAPRHVQAWSTKASALKQLGRTEAAEKAYLQALVLNPHFTEAQLGLAYIYQTAGRLDTALQLFQAALPQIQDARQREHVQYLVSALSSSTAPERAPDHYVRDLFDDYAKKFDRDLVERLKYQVPQMIEARIEERFPRRWAHALDLGCGTGLWGKLARPHCDRLTGLDISQGMIDQAEKLSIYDELVCAEILAHLSHQGGVYDLIVAADVFVYVGRLDDIFAAARKALVPGGVFAFSVELTDDPVAAGYKLQASGRYAHVGTAVQGLAAQHDLQFIEHVEGVGREERGVPVRTGIYLFQVRA